MMEPEETGAEEADALAQTARAGERLLKVLLASLAAFTVVFSAGLMFALGGGRAHLVGRLAVAVAALFILGALDTKAMLLAARHRPLLAPDPPGYRQYVVWSALGLLIAAALLLGLAWYLP